MTICVLRILHKFIRKQTTKGEEELFLYTSFDEELYIIIGIHTYVHISNVLRIVNFCCLNKHLEK